MKKPIFLRAFQEKLLENSAMAIPFADFSRNLIKNLNLFIESLHATGVKKK